MRVHVAHPSEHQAIVSLPYRLPLDDWDMDNVQQVLGLHRHVVKLLEYEHISYVVKELPDELAMREYRLLRELDEHGLPTAEVVAALIKSKKSDLSADELEELSKLIAKTRKEGR